MASAAVRLKAVVLLLFIHCLLLLSNFSGGIMFGHCFILQCLVSQKNQETVFLSTSTLEKLSNTRSLSYMYLKAYRAWLNPLSASKLCTRSHLHQSVQLQ